MDPISLLAGLTIGLHTATVHLPRDDSLNERNWGLSVMTESGYVAGAYRNSVDRTSFYLGKQLRLTDSIDLTVGLITGYQRERVFTNEAVCADGNIPDRTKGEQCYRDRGFSRGPVTLLAAPSVRLGTYYGLTPRLSLLPAYESGKIKAALHLSIEHTF